jgi:hypothetical protein
MRRAACVLSLCALALSGAGRAFAQAGAPDAGEENVDDAVARALFEQGLRLFHQHRYSEAHQLFAESIARSPDGAYARSARQMLTRCDERTAPAAPVDPYATTVDPYVAPAEPVDPYASATATEAAPLDPYAASDAAEATTLDPYAPPASATPGASEPAVDERREVRHTAALFGGLFGLHTSFGLIAGLGDEDVSGGELVLMLGSAVAGGAAGYWIGEQPVSRAQLHTAMGGYAWGLGLGLLVTSLADSPPVTDCGDCGTQVTSQDYLWTSAVGATLGLGAGVWLASRDPSENDLALVHSVGGYGLLGGLLLGVAIHPDDERGYALTSALGASAGLATGLWLASRGDVPERRMGYMDLAVAGGAVAPWVFYALAGGDGGDAATLQLTGVASLATGAVGGWLGWYWTRDLGAAPGATSGAAERASAPPGLLQRGTGGSWRLSAVPPRPFVLAPAAADPRPRMGLGIDLVSGAF